MKKIKYRTFTLAEILITIVIIGVIAALTIQNLVVKYQKEETVTKLKKTYSSLSQTTNLAILENGPISNWEIGAIKNGDNSEKFLNTYVVPYMNVKSEAVQYLNNNWDPKDYWMNGPEDSYVRQGPSKFTLLDGTTMYGHIFDGDFIIIVDINGDKRPNQRGRDRFWFMYVLNSSSENFGKFVPLNFEKDREYLLSNKYAGNCNKNAHGDNCAAVIIKDGWQIKDDYPW